MGQFEEQTLSHCQIATFSVYPVVMARELLVLSPSQAEAIAFVPSAVLALHLGDQKSSSYLLVN